MQIKKSEIPKNLIKNCECGKKMDVCVEMIHFPFKCCKDYITLVIWHCHDCDTYIVKKGDIETGAEKEKSSDDRVESPVVSEPATDTALKLVAAGQ